MRIKLDFQDASILLIMFLSVFFFSCKQENKQSPLREKIKVSANNNSSTIKALCEQIQVRYERKNYNRFSVFKLLGEDLFFEIVLIDELEKALLKVNDNFHLTHLNFTYETDKSSSISEIKAFNCGDNTQILLLPLATEELLTYQVIEIKSNTTLKSLGMLSYETVNLDELLNTNTSSKLEQNKDGYLLKIINKEDDKPIVIYDKLNPLDNFKDINQVFPKVETYLNIRSAPNLENSKIIGKAYQADKLFVLTDINEKWALIYCNGSFGYVARNFIRKK